MIMDSPKARWGRKLSKRRVTPQELRELSKSSYSPSLYDFLLTASHNAPIHCSIPECLLRSSRINPTLLCSQNCLLQVYAGSHSFNKFFEKVDLARQTESRGDEKVGAGPQYVVKGSGNWQLCMNKKECCRQWPKAEYVRRFVQGDKAKPAVYRFKRSRNSVSSAIYLIKNASISSHNPRPRSLALQRAVTPTSIYQHDTFAFVYAGKLLKASFSPYHPYPSLLSPRSTTRPSSQVERSVRLKTPTAFHLVDTQHLETCKVSLVTDKVPALEAAVSQFTASLEVAFKSQVVSLELDYIRLDPEHYLLIDLLFITLQSRSLQPVLELRSKFARVTTPSPVSPRLCVPDWRLLPASSRLSLALSDQAAPSPEALDLEKQAKGQLQGVEELYDGLMARVRRAKVEQRDLVEELEAEYGRQRGAEALVDRFFHAFILKSEVTALYENKLKQDFDAMKAGILLVLRGRVPLASRKRIRASHCKIEDLAGLVKVLCRVTREEGRTMGLREELVHLVAQRLEDFLKEIASLGRKSH